MVLTLCAMHDATAAAACAGPTWPIEPLGPHTWWVRAAEGDAQAANRGRVSNLLVHRDGRRVWLLGSGPSPAAARVLACQLRRALGLRITDVIAPWARPELVLGHRGLPGVRLWAHADVAAAMARQCAGCVERLRQRLGDAARELGADPAQVPTRTLQGDQGRLGPWHWQRLRRSGHGVVTVWRLTDGTASAHGLLWADGPPDGRDADLAVLARSTEALAEPPAGQPRATRWVPEQGVVLDARAPALQAAYWRALIQWADGAVGRGEAQADAAAMPWPQALPPAWAWHPRHALNLQRAWREAEDRALALPPSAPASAPATAPATAPAPSSR